MTRFLVIAFQSGTYGNFISQQFLSLAPDLFSVKRQPFGAPPVTPSGNRYYHNMQPWLGNTLYFAWASYRYLNNVSAEQLWTQIQQDPDYPLLDDKKYNIVLTHECSVSGLSVLNKVLPNSKILKITYDFEDIDWIAKRFVDIIKYIDCKTDKPIEMSVEQHQQFLLEADQNCNGCIEFPVKHRENIVYIKQLIDTHFR